MRIFAMFFRSYLQLIYYSFFDIISIYYTERVNTVLKTNYLISNKKGTDIYDKIKDLPIIDYHCHLSPEEIYNDEPFNNIGEMWLEHDHYKWRLMRTFGIDEKFITGNSSWQDKFTKYVLALEYAAGNPLYHWSHMELSRFFNINMPITHANAEKIYYEANAFISENKLSPRKLIAQSQVEIICTTDDITDTLEFHKKINKDLNFKTQVLPSFRTDNLFLVYRNNYKDYINKLSEISGINIYNLKSLKDALLKRLDFFCQNGCRFTDVGIQYFPDNISDDSHANAFFTSILSGNSTSYEDYIGFIGHMYVFLASEYRKRNLIMQLHLSVQRNTNSPLFKQIGTDCGGDCIGDVINGKSLIQLLDAVNCNGGLPKTIIYTLNPSNAEQIASISGSFPGVSCGAAWWFCDHKRGIRREIEIIAENSSLGSFLGMLTDSRSFLSYARHDYFRRILSDILGEWVEKGEFYENNAEKLAKKISYSNIKELICK